MYEPYEKEWLDAEDRCDALKHQRDQLREALGLVLMNAELSPDPKMGGTTDVYLVPAEDIDAARAALKATEEG